MSSPKQSSWAVSVSRSSPAKSVESDSANAENQPNHIESQSQNIPSSARARRSARLSHEGSSLSLETPTGIRTRRQHSDMTDSNNKMDADIPSRKRRRTHSPWQHEQVPEEEQHESEVKQALETYIETSEQILETAARATLIEATTSMDIDVALVSPPNLGCALESSEPPIESDERKDVELEQPNNIPSTPESSNIRKLLSPRSIISQLQSLVGEASKVVFAQEEVHEVQNVLFDFQVAVRQNDKPAESRVDLKAA